MDDENGGRLREYGLGAGQGAIETHDYFVVPHGHQVSFCYIYLYYGSYIAEEMDWTGLDLLDDATMVGKKSSCLSWVVYQFQQASRVAD